MADYMDCNDTEFGQSNEKANNWADYGMHDKWRASELYWMY